MNDAPNDEMVRRVRIVTAVTLGIALSLIALSALTLKADQVNQLPRVPLSTPAPPITNE